MSTFSVFFPLDPEPLLLLLNPIQQFVHDPGEEQPNTHDLLGRCQYKSHKQKMELIVRGCCSAVTAAAAAVDL